MGIHPSRIHPESPPILMIRNDEVFLLAPGLWNESVTSHPSILPGSGRRVFVDTRGDLVFRVNEKEAARLEVNALHDARLLMDEKARILLLTNPTNEYGHGALGDDIEAASITLVNTAGTSEVSKVIYLPDGIINMMAEYTQFHFSTEEKYMQRFDYPDHDEHKPRARKVCQEGSGSQAGLQEWKSRYQLRNTELP